MVSNRVEAGTTRNMSDEQTNIATWLRTPSAAARIASPDEVFSLLSRSFDMPADWAALVTYQGGERAFFKAGSVVSGGEIDEILFVRATPLALSFTSDKVSSLDRYRCSASVRVPVSIVLERSELVDFRKLVVGSRRSATVETLAEYLQPHVEEALGQSADGRGVEVLIESASREDVAAEIAEALAGVTFSAGLKIDGSIVVEFDSSVYRQVRQARVAGQRRREEFTAKRRIEEAAHEARLKHAERLGELLEELRERAEATPGVEIPDLIRTYPETERGELYEALMGATGDAGSTQWIVVGCGDELLFFAPDSLEKPAKTIAMGGQAGSVRSVQLQVDGAGRRWLYAGAATGVYETQADGDGGVRVYAAEASKDVRGGVNSVALAGDRVFATHSELGLLWWERSPGLACGSLLDERTKNAQAVRCVQFFDGRLYLSIDNDVVVLRADDLAGEPEILGGSRSQITALWPTGWGVFAGNAEGQLLCWGPNEADEPEVLHAGRGRAAKSVTLVDADRLKRLVFTDTSLAVYARVIDDTFTCRYEAGGQTLERVEAAPDLIVACNELRDRLICWRTGEPKSPFATISVGRITGRSVQDACLIPVV